MAKYLPTIRILGNGLHERITWDDDGNPHSEIIQCNCDIVYYCVPYTLDEYLTGRYYEDRLHGWLGIPR